MKKNRTLHGGRARVNRLLQVDFLRFGVVGAIGFSITFVLLYIFYGRLGAPYAITVLFTNEAGLISNFIFHEKWTYKRVDHSHKSLMTKFVHFHVSSWTGIALIFFINIFCVKVLEFNYLVAQMIASGIVMFWNFFWTKYFIFKGKTPAILSHPEETVGIEE